MAEKDLNRIVAKNLAYFMSQPKCLYRNPNALGSAAKIAPNTVQNLLHPGKRTVTTAKPIGYPNLDTLQKLADKLGCQVWQLLHPNIERAMRESEMYQSIEKSFPSLTASTKQ